MKHMKTPTLKTLLTLLIFTEVSRAAPLDIWTVRSPVPPVPRLEAVTYGNGQFVAVGHGPTILTSAGGANWLQRQGPTNLAGDLSQLSIAYGNGQFVAAGWGHKERALVIISSADGVNWVQRLVGPYYETLGADKYSIAYGNGRFVVVAYTGNDTGATSEDGAIQKSADLISWQIVTNISSGPTGTVTLERMPAIADQEFYRAYSE